MPLAAGEAFTIEVDWRDGTRTTLADAKAGRLYGIRQVGGLAIQPTNRKTAVFADLSTRLEHEHRASKRDEFVQQPALPGGLNHSGKGLAATDIDGDGRPDIAARNAGRNTAYELHCKPVRLFYGDGDGDGVMELAEALADAKTKQWKPIRTLEVFAKTFLHIRGTVTRNKLFAAAALPRLIGPAFGEMNSREITVFPVLFSSTKLFF